MNARSYAPSILTSPPMRASGSLLRGNLDKRLLAWAGDLCGLRPHDHVDFGPNTKSLCIHARLNRETGPGHEATIIVRFVVVHVHAVAVNFLAKAVASPMNEVLAIAGCRDDVARRAIDLPAVNRL